MTSAIGLGATDLLVGAFAGILLALILPFVVRRLRGTPAVSDPPDDWLRSPDDRRWEQDAVALQHTTLATVRASATAWGSSISALLGVFALVAFIKGPTAVTDVKGDEAEVAAVMILAAVVFAAAAIVLASLAAQGTATNLPLLDGWGLMNETERRTGTAIKQLNASRALALIALAIVFVAVGIVWFTSLRERDEVVARGRVPSCFRRPAARWSAVRSASTADARW